MTTDPLDLAKKLQQRLRSRGLSSTEAQHAADMIEELEQEIVRLRRDNAAVSRQPPPQQLKPYQKMKPTNMVDIHDPVWLGMRLGCGFCIVAAIASLIVGILLLGPPRH